MSKKIQRPRKVYTIGNRSSQISGYNLGKGQMDKIPFHSGTTALSPTEKVSIKSDLIDWGYEYWEGLFRLGKNSSPELKKLFPSLRQSLVREGEVVVINKDNHFLLADIQIIEGVKQIQRNLANEIVSLSIVYKNKLGLIGNLVKDIAEADEANFTNNDFVIFTNNSQSLPELCRARHKLNQIIKIEESFLKDLEVSRPRIIAYHPLLTDTNRAEQLKDYFFKEANDLITIASLNEGDKPTLHNWEGKSHQASLWENYTKSLTEWKRLNGIRTNTARKKERNLLDEVSLTEEQFEALENNRYNSLVEALEECKQKWGWQYSLLKPDEVEKNETDSIIQGLEKQLRIEELKKQINELKQENSFKGKNEQG